MIDKLIILVNVLVEHAASRREDLHQLQRVDHRLLQVHLHLPKVSTLVDHEVTLLVHDLQIARLAALLLRLKLKFSILVYPACATVLDTRLSFSYICLNIK